MIIKLLAPPPWGRACPEKRGVGERKKKEEDLNRLSELI
jgi:hypothetical protein